MFKIGDKVRMRDIQRNRDSWPGEASDNFIGREGRVVNFNAGQEIVRVKFKNDLSARSCHAWRVELVADPLSETDAAAIVYTRQELGNV